MKRSVAPSQSGAAKRARFSTPFKNENEERKTVPLFNRGLNVLPGPPDPDRNGDYKNDENSTQNSVPQVGPPHGFMYSKSNSSLTHTSPSSSSTPSGPTPSPLSSAASKPHLLSFHSPLAVSTENKPESSSNVQNGTINSNLTQTENYYNVLWCKFSKKKHKKWESDAILATHGRKATLYDMEGKEIGKCSGYKESILSSLEGDQTLSFGGKEILVISRILEENFKSGKCFMQTSAAPNQTSLKTKDISRPYVNPQLSNSSTGNNSLKFQKSGGASDGVETISPRHDPKAPNALVMPRPSQDHQWYHNKNQLQVVDVVVDPYITRHMRPHQRDGIVFLYECVMGMRDYNGYGVILADDMGLGKTLQCIALLWTLYKQGPYGGKPVLHKILIVTPSSLVKNWFLEFKKWLGLERISVFAVEADKRIDEYLLRPKCPVLIISYEMFLRNIKEVEKVNFDLIICDEGHRLKNTSIKTATLLSSLPVRRRVVLTGTPIQNDMQEFYSIVEFCNPGVLGTSTAFHKVYEQPILASRQPTATEDQISLGNERSSELCRLTKLFLLRRTQDVNNKYLPPKVEIVVFCRPSILQLNLYRQILNSQMIRRFLAGHYDGPSHLISIAALKKLCNHPALLYQSLTSNESDEDEEGNIYQGVVFYPQGYKVPENLLQDGGKLNVLASLLKQIYMTTPRDKVVLVANYTKTLDLLGEFCSSQGYNCCRLDGQTPSGSRMNIVRQFNMAASNHFIFLLSSKAGGVGLNLVGASRLILYDIDWNPANDLQAMARIWRDGQKRKVHLYRLLTTGTIEEKIYQRQINKQSLSGSIVDARDKGKVKFSLEELRDLFSLNEQTICDTHELLKCQCKTNSTKITNDTNHPKIMTTSLRQCQLGSSEFNDGQSRKKNLTMDELLDWKHISPDELSAHPEWHLLPSSSIGDNNNNNNNNNSNVTFLFWNETKALPIPDEAAN